MAMLCRKASQMEVQASLCVDSLINQEKQFRISQIIQVCQSEGPFSFPDILLKSTNS